MGGTHPGTGFGCQMQSKLGGQMLEGPADVADSKGPYFTEEQYKQLVNMLNKDAEEQKANMTGTITCLMSGITCREWIIECGATHHITSSLDLLEQGRHVNESSRIKMHLPTGDKANVTC